jgi:condensin complex subunit 3
MWHIQLSRVRGLLLNPTAVPAEVETDAVNRPEGEEEVETTSSRFVTKLLRHLLSGMDAKDKNVRFRVTLLTVSMINGLGEME